MIKIPKVLFKTKSAAMCSESERCEMTTMTEKKN